MDSRTIKIKKLLSIEEATKELFTIDKAQDAQAFFKKNDIDFTVEEVRELGKIISLALKNAIDKNSELSEEYLIQVSGGTIDNSEFNSLAYEIASIAKIKNPNWKIV